MPAYKDEKNNTWYCQFYVKDWSGKRKHKTKRGFKRKKDAEAYERQMSDKISADSVTFGMLLDSYRELLNQRLVLKNIKPSTHYRYKQDLKLYVEPFFDKDMSISSLKPENINKWLVHLATLKSKRTQRLYSPKVKNLAKSTLSTLMKYAIKRNWLTKNPVTQAEKISSGMKKQLTVWTIQDYQLFYSALENDMYRLLFNILYWAGLRIGEALALKPSCLLENDKLDISENKYLNIIGTTKTVYSTRTIVIPHFLYAQIEMYIQNSYKMKKDDLLFTVCYRTVYEHMRAKVRALGLPYLTPHGLRHSNASLLLKTTKDIALVSHNLGHKNPKTTLSVYSHMIPGSDSKAAEMLNALATSGELKN